jgi:hypothetical protein
MSFGDSITPLSVALWTDLFEEDNDAGVLAG